MHKRDRKPRTLTTILTVILRALTLGVATLSLVTFNAIATISSPFTQASAAAFTRHRYPVAAQVTNVNEHANLRLVSHHSGVLYEQGIPNSGTPGGLLTVQIKISYTQATIAFVAYPSGGSLSGRGQASVYAEGSIAHFNGSVSITHGTGRFARVSTSSLHIEGMSNRRTYAVSLSVSGKVRS